MQHRFLTQQEFVDLPIGQDLVFDIEIFRNFLFIAFKVVNTNQYVVFSGDENVPFDHRPVLWFMSRHRCIGFNSASFDMPILTYAMTGATIVQIKQMCDKIIIDRIKKYEVYKEFQLNPLPVNHIDLIEVCPQTGPLELYGAKLHAKSILAMPSSPEMFLTDEEKSKISWYCLKDLDITELIFQNLTQEIELRENITEQFFVNTGIDVMSCSDAQMAEKIMREEIKRKLGRLPKSKSKPGDYFEYEAPSNIQFLTEPLKELFRDIKDSDFVIGPTGHPVLPENLDGRQINIGQATYTIGIGGLHSTETCQAVVANEGGWLLDVDVASQYPRIILNNNIKPEHLGDTFTEIYNDQVEARLEAKRAGRKQEADSRKIIVNGLYGKLSEKWSCVYSPKNTIQVTLTGQLTLLMLIEYAEQRGIRVISANTDGLVFDVRNAEHLEVVRETVAQWSSYLGFETEETFYKAIYSRDVNNYIAVKLDGTLKTKGAYLLPKDIFRFHKNPDCNIVSKAICKYLTDGIPVRETAESSDDIRDFVIVRQIKSKGGAEFTGEKIGKVVRWYYSRYSEACITVVKSGNKVAKSEGCKPLPILPDTFPDDVDLEKYVGLAEEGLYLIGAKVRFDRQSRIFTEEELAFLV